MHHVAVLTSFAGIVLFAVDDPKDVTFSINMTTAISVATIIATAISGAIIGATKIIVAYLEKRDAYYEKRDIAHQETFKNTIAEFKTITDRFDVTANGFRDEHRSTMESIMHIQKETIETVGEMKGAIQLLSMRLDRREETESKKVTNEQTDPSKSGSVRSTKRPLPDR